MRLPSGVPGFDEMVQGGLPAGASVVLQGPPGQEKLRFALTFLAEGLKGGGSGLVVVASQSPDAILSELRGLGVDLDRVVQENRLRIVDWYSQREEPVQDVEERGIVLRSSIDLTNVGVALSRGIAALGGDLPKRAVVELLSPATSIFEVGQVYAFAQSSKGKFVRFTFTALYLLEKEMHAPPDLSTLHQPFDGVIEIERARIGDAIVRKIGVLHLKDTTPASAFRILETVPEGLRVVREPTKSPSVPEPPSTIPPPIRAPPRPSSERVQPPSLSPAAKAAGPTKPAVFEEKEESPTRAYLIMQIARERLKLNPGDPDALFATAAAQATLDDSRGALDALDRLTKIDDRYPGLWALKTKLHARLGELDKARQSRERAEQATEWEGEELMVPCPLCEAPVAEGASRCPKCGATFLTEAKITDELDALGHALIQEKVQEELGSGPPGPPERPPKPESPKPEPFVKPQVVAPPKKAEKPTAKQGLTNGFVRERPAARPPGMTNGLKGRTNGLTNGLRGRTNGLRGRTNGLTNGLTNVLGRTNGLGSAAGRTNGLTNGLVSLRRGITNGLTNGNGFTNGLGSPRFQREVRLNRWKLYVIPVVTVSLLVIPLFLSPDFGGIPYPIQVDGDFSDWPAAALIAQSTSAAVDANVDIVRFGTFDNRDRLAFYAEVRGSALTGGGTPPRYDSLRIFLDTDQNAATGYVVAGMGADRLLEVSGWGGRVNRTTVSEWDTNRASRDWNGWIKSASIPAAVLGSRLELGVSWASLLPQKGPIGVYAHFQSYRGDFDETDFVLNPFGPSLLVRVLPSPPEVLTGTDVTFLGLDLSALSGDVSYSEITVTAIGTAVPSAVSAVRLVDSTGGLIQERIPTGRDITFQFSPRSISSGQSQSLFVRGDVLGATGETLGLSIDSPADISAAPALVTIAHQPSVRTVGYLGAVPAGRRIDGGFSDWANVSGDPLDLGRRAGVDLREYSFERTGSTIEVYIRVEGRAFEGVVVPEQNSVAAGGTPLPGFADSDRDTVPDADDPMPYDFNNDGVDDVATSGDYDGDGVADYPFGPDWYLNTTIPAAFPPLYANRPVSLYIGPIIRPPLFGEDVARVFIDSDNDPSTGFRINVLGADYLAEFRGRSGELTNRALSEFAGRYPLEWSWNPILSIAAATDYARLEASFPTSGLNLGNQSLAYFEVMDWTLDKDASLDPILRIGGRSAVSSTPSYSPGDVHTLDLSGNQKWFFTDTNSAETVCTLNKDASTTAGAAATSMTLSQGQTACWYSPDGLPDTISGVWEVILDIDKTTDGTQVLSPSGNGAKNDWEVDGIGCTSEANEWQCVDETVNNGDADYVQSVFSVVSDSLYDLPDWSTPPSPLNIVNVQVEASCRKLAAPAVSFGIIIKSGVNTYLGASGLRDCADSATYSVLTDTWTTDPADGASWSLADINALQAGVRDGDTKNRDVRASHVKVTVAFAPVYSVEINRCENAGCTTTTNLYPATNFNSFGSDVTIQTGSIAAQTLTDQEHIQWKITLVNGGTVTVRYNGVNPGTDDSRGTVALPEFEEVVIPIVGSLLVVAISRRWRVARSRGESRRNPTRLEDVPRQ